MNADDYLQRVMRVTDKIVASVMDAIERDKSITTDNLRNAVVGHVVALEVEHAGEVSELALEKLKDVMGDMKAAEVPAVDRAWLSFKAEVSGDPAPGGLKPLVDESEWDGRLPIDDLGVPPRGTLHRMPPRQARLIVHSLPGMPMAHDPNMTPGEMRIERKKPRRPFFEITDKGEVKLFHPVGDGDVFLHLSAQPDSLFTFENRGTAHVNCHCPGCSSRGQLTTSSDHLERKVAASEKRLADVLEQSCGAARKYTLCYLGLKFWAFDRKGLDAATASINRLAQLDEALSVARSTGRVTLIWSDLDYHVTPDAEVMSGLTLMQRTPRNGGN
jgi:hypothetical protein